ncbi:MYXO-CTERM sorting domain-containing protein [Streptomyces sp. NPDC006458]|uniref:MYXO-CTERM sorting domain-containing protein n=1 Tax=Streptomyces sp. NPDC006458 TaxID=3154302 RepID=UPI0033BB4C99
MATVDPAHRTGFALIPALAGGPIAVGLCAVAGANPEPWMWLSALAAGFWGYRYARRWTTAGDTDGPDEARAEPHARD